MALRIVVTLHEDGRLQIEAPPDKLSALGALELAKHMLLRPTEPAPRIQPVSVIPSIGANGKAG